MRCVCDLRQLFAVNDALVTYVPAPPRLRPHATRAPRSITFIMAKVASDAQGALTMHAELTTRPNGRPPSIAGCHVSASCPSSRVPRMPAAAIIRRAELEAQRILDAARSEAAAILEAARRREQDLWGARLHGYLSKNSGRNWQRRFFALRGSMLLYYATHEVRGTRAPPWAALIAAGWLTCLLHAPPPAARCVLRAASPPPAAVRADRGSHGRGGTGRR